eukprot:1159951-Pelagomonas_calceolata.AAC.11
MTTYRYKINLQEEEALTRVYVCTQDSASGMENDWITLLVVVGCVGVHAAAESMCPARILLSAV